ncbi:MAG: hypothetical protein IV107_03955 [Paucibacter sp.]|nr:hypothetical protein [Roseateles sp.]
MEDKKRPRTPRSSDTPDYANMRPPSDDVLREMRNKEYARRMAEIEQDFAEASRRVMTKELKAKGEWTPEAGARINRQLAARSDFDFQVFMHLAIPGEVRCRYAIWRGSQPL